MDDKTLGIIEAIGKQWKFIATIFVIIIFIVKWKTIWSFVENFTQIRVKRGENEIEFHRKESEKEEVKDHKIKQDKVNPESELLEDENEKLEKNKEPDSLLYLYHNTLRNKKFKDAETHFQLLLEKENDLLKRNELKNRDFYLRHIFGDIHAFEELEKFSSTIVNDNEQKSYSLYYLGLIYNESNNYKKSTDLILEALQLTSKDEQKVMCISKLSIIYYEYDFVENSLNIILDHINNINNRIPKSNLYKSIADYYKKTDNKILEAVAYQKALELAPNNTSLMFDSAYNYCEAENDLKDIGVLLYKKLITINPENSSALNNLGVAYKKLDLDIKSVNAYKLSFEKESSLAASNIAYLLINSGFKDEATDFLNKAKDLNEETHDSIFNATTHLNNKVRIEKEKEENIIKKATKKYKFLAHYGDSAFTNTVISIEASDEWSFENKIVDLKLTDKLINLKWANGEEKHEIKGILIKNSISSTFVKPKKNPYSYSEESKYTYTNHMGYGYISSKNEINFLFEIENKIVEFKFNKKYYAQ